MKKGKPLSNANSFTLDEVIVVSVVRDWAMYEKCVARNPMFKGCRMMPIDNRERNERIPVCYNRVLDGLKTESSAWLVFCHEDFQMKECLADRLKHVDKTSLYGPIGGRLSREWLLWRPSLVGLEEQCSKDGSNLQMLGCDPGAVRTVDTVDCQCLIAHASLLQKYALRFDEELSFDLYTEDFCANAFMRHGIKTEILPMKCRHWSTGVIQPRFFEQKAYLDRKYPRWEFFGSVGYSFGKGRTFCRRLQIAGRAFCARHFPNLEKMVMKWICR